MTRFMVSPRHGMDPPDADWRETVTHTPGIKVVHDGPVMLLIEAEEAAITGLKDRLGAGFIVEPDLPRKLF